MREITKEDVEQVTADLRERGLMSDTGPLSDGRRSAGQWMNAIREDYGIIQLQLEATMRDGHNNAERIASALKEARRMESDIYRFAEEVHGLKRKEIDAIRS